MRLSPRLQGGSSIRSHLMKINLILSLSHLPWRETSAAFSHICSCLSLVSSSRQTGVLRPLLHNIGTRKRKRLGK